MAQSGKRERLLLAVATFFSFLNEYASLVAHTTHYHSIYNKSDAAATHHTLITNIVDVIALMGCSSLSSIHYTHLTESQKRLPAFLICTVAIPLVCAFFVPNVIMGVAVDAFHERTKGRKLLVLAMGFLSIMALSSTEGLLSDLLVRGSDYYAGYVLFSLFIVVLVSIVARMTARVPRQHDHVAKNGGLAFAMLLGVLMLTAVIVAVSVDPLDMFGYVHNKKGSLPVRAIVAGLGWTVMLVSIVASATIGRSAPPEAVASKSAAKPAMTPPKPATAPSKLAANSMATPAVGGAVVAAAL